METRKIENTILPSFHAVIILAATKEKCEYIYVYEDWGLSHGNYLFFW
jgi:hypothetical protein